MHTLQRGEIRIGKGKVPGGSEPGIHLRARLQHRSMLLQDETVSSISQTHRRHHRERGQRASPARSGVQLPRHRGQVCRKLASAQRVSADLSFQFEGSHRVHHQELRLSKGRPFRHASQVRGRTGLGVADESGFDERGRRSEWQFQKAQLLDTKSPVPSRDIYKSTASLL